MNEVVSQTAGAPLILDLGIREAKATLNLRGEHHGEERRLAVDVDFTMTVQPEELPWLDGYRAEFMALFFNGDGPRSHHLPALTRFPGLVIDSQEEGDCQHQLRFAVGQLNPAVRGAAVYPIHRLTKFAVGLVAGRRLELRAQAQLQVSAVELKQLGRCYELPVSIGVEPITDDMFDGAGTRKPKPAADDPPPASKKKASKKRASKKRAATAE